MMQVEYSFMDAIRPVNDLLSFPSPSELEMIESQDGYVAPLTRKKAKYKNRSERFMLKKRTFGSQYANIYFKRLETLKPFATAMAQKKWNQKGNLDVLQKLLDIGEGKSCIVIGTLYKEMPLVPRVLDQFTKERSILLVPPRNSFVSSNDKLILEDETGRTLLVGSKVNPDNFLTGLVVAIKGKSLKGGEFELEDICFPGIPPQIPLQPSEAKYVVLISGMKVGDPVQNPLALEMFIDFVTGNLGSMNEGSFASTIVRVIVAGNSIRAPEPPKQQDVDNNRSLKLSASEHQKMVSPLQELDALIAQLSSSLPVDIMPGETDPSNYTMPQQAFSKCIFPLGSQFQNLNSVTNPYECEIDDVSILGSSGQTIDHMERYMVIHLQLRTHCNQVMDSKLEMMEKSLSWRHLAPSAPDQLPCYPFHEYDPFIIERCPHVYFLGNQKEFQTKVVKGPNKQTTRIIMIPEFATTQTALLLNLATLDVHPISFNAAL